MNKTGLTAIISIIGLAAMATITVPIVKANSCGMEHGQNHKMEMNKPVAKETLSPETIHSEHLPLKVTHTHHIPALSLSIEKAILAVKAGEDAIALSELQKAQSLLEAVKLAVSQQVQPTVVNSKCPIMGGTINPDKVSDSLVRDFKGQKVAFCCGGCPGQWDKLSDAEKEAKLSKVITEKPSSQKHNH